LERSATDELCPTARTTLRDNRGDELPVDYQLTYDRRRWEVYDVGELNESR
jgi:hypothetical protein